MLKYFQWQTSECKAFMYVIQSNNVHASFAVVNQEHFGPRRVNLAGYHRISRRFVEIEFNIGVNTVAWNAPVIILMPGPPAGRLLVYDTVIAHLISAWANLISVSQNEGPRGAGHRLMPNESPPPRLSSRWKMFPRWLLRRKLLLWVGRDLATSAEMLELSVGSSDVRMARNNNYLIIISEFSRERFCEMLLGLNDRMLLMVLVIMKD